MITKINSGSCGNQIQNNENCRDNGKSTKRLRGACGAMCLKGPLVVNEAFYALTCTNEVDATMWRLSANAASKSLSGVRQTASDGRDRGPLALGDSSSSDPDNLNKQQQQKY